MAVPSDPASADKARLLAARELVATYHRQELGALLERVREGFAQLDAGAIDEFDLDALIHGYKQAAGDLWKFCGTTGSQVLHAANTVTYKRERGELIDWWAQRTPRERPAPRSSDDGSGPGD